jgi:hypothetical protein
LVNSKTGIDGVALSWVNYHDEMRQWIAEVMPLIEQAGLRKPHQPPRDDWSQPGAQIRNDR